VARLRDRHVRPSDAPIRLPENPVSAASITDPFPGAATALREQPHGLQDTNAYSGPIDMPALRELGEIGVRVIPLALGTSTFGWSVDADEAAAVLDRFAIQGGTLVDAAGRYAPERSEVILGRWMRDRGTRDQVLISTEVSRRPGLRSPHGGMATAVDDSLRRLQTDRIDLLFFHGDDESTPLEEGLSAADALIRAGKVRSIAASAYSADRLIEARVQAANGLPRFSAISARYNLMERADYEGQLELVSRAQRLAVMPSFALAGGILSGTVRRRSGIARDTRGQPRARHLNRRGRRVLSVLDRVATAHGCTVASVAIAWLLAKPSVVAPMASASRPEQVDELIAAATLTLSRTELLDLDRASA
jgi:aryl-alcohol dehydrogenase-like predicted oxidoreductase